MLKPTPRGNPSGAEGVSTLTLQTLFDLEETPLLRYAFSLIGRRAVAEEIVQEVFLQLHARWDEIDAPRAWLYRSVRNRAWNHLRDHRRETLQGSDGGGQSAGTDDDTPEVQLLRIEAAATLRQLMEELGETDRQLLRLKYFENLKYREISDRTGLSIGNVGYRLSHILKELAGKLRPLGIDKDS
jgi:RNA polymerase sigma-70 factor (ECF subfamily)